jgi:hypothetical protein
MAAAAQSDRNDAGNHGATTNSSAGGYINGSVVLINAGAVWYPSGGHNRR